MDKKFDTEQSFNKSDMGKKRFSINESMEPGKGSGQRKSALRQAFKRRPLSKGYKHKIYLDDEDVTPLPLYSMMYDECAEPQMEARDTIESEHPGSISKTGQDRSITIFGVQNLSKFQTQLHHQTLATESQFQQSYLTTTAQTDEDVYLLEPTYAESEASVESLEEALQDRPAETTMPAQVTVILTETSTFYICDLPSYSAVVDTDEGKMIN